MSDIQDVERIVKRGEEWLEISADRRSKGVEYFVRTLPCVEEFIAGLGNGETQPLTAHGRNWVSMGETDIRVRYLNQEMDTDNYNLISLHSPLVLGRQQANLSFLRFVGISDQTGVRFMVLGPAGYDDIRNNLARCAAGARQLFKDYITPVHIQLKISSLEK